MWPRTLFVYRQGLWILQGKTLIRVINYQSELVHEIFHSQQNYSKVGHKIYRGIVDCMNYNTVAVISEYFDSGKMRVCDSHSISCADMLGRSCRQVMAKLVCIGGRNCTFIGASINQSPDSQRLSSCRICYSYGKHRPGNASLQMRNKRIINNRHQ